MAGYQGGLPYDPDGFGSINTLNLGKKLKKETDWYLFLIKSQYLFVNKLEQAKSLIWEYVNVRLIQNTFKYSLSVYFRTVTIKILEIYFFEFNFK